MKFLSTALLFSTIFAGSVSAGNQYEDERIFPFDGEWELKTVRCLDGTELAEVHREIVQKSLDAGTSRELTIEKNAVVSEMTTSCTSKTINYKTDLKFKTVSSEVNSFKAIELVFNGIVEDEREESCDNGNEVGKAPMYILNNDSDKKLELLDPNNEANICGTSDTVLVFEKSEWF